MIISNVSLNSWNYTFNPKEVFKIFNWAPQNLCFDPNILENFQLNPGEITKLSFKNFGISHFSPLKEISSPKFEIQ